MIRKLNHLVRVVGDATFTAGALALGWFLLGLKTGWSLTPRRELLPRVLSGLFHAGRWSHRRWNCWRRWLAHLSAVHAL